MISILPELDEQFYHHQAVSSFLATRRDKLAQFLGHSFNRNFSVFGEYFGFLWHITTRNLGEGANRKTW